MEVRDAIVAGKTTVIIPTGGTEQNGPHMALGKHNYLVKYKAGEIAMTLGNALVAPVIAYVPEGDINPPTGHMRFAGTVTLPQDVFSKVLDMPLVASSSMAFSTSLSSATAAAIRPGSNRWLRPSIPNGWQRTCACIR
jgi:creatinine amidohydrolase/Fe(II)-dependent formamide hydrolase-like protein